MELQLDTGKKNYSIKIEAGILEACGYEAAKLCKGRRAFVITDSNVAPLYGKQVLDSLRASGFQPVLEILPAGEQTKNLATVEKLYGRMHEEDITRADLVIALGGGVVGDIAGFVSDTWLRGLCCMQIPTTLLAQTDSSVGGKCGVNMPFGKNLVGAFHQPDLVLIDPVFLKTLPEAEFSGGMAEVIKYGCIRDANLFEALHRGMESQMAQVIGRCVELKKEIVERDELDRGERMLLNFGHTFGHVIEKLGNYTDYSHGRAVAIGMVLAARVGAYLELTPPAAARRIAALCASYGLETTCPYPVEKFAPVMLGDKKRMGDTLHLVLLKEIGQAITYPVETGRLEDLLHRALKEGR